MYGAPSLFLQERLFSLAYRAYGREAAIPVNICVMTLCTKEVDWDQNVAQLQLVQYCSEQRRRKAIIRRDLILWSLKEAKVPTPWQPKTGRYSANSEILFI